MYLKPDCQKIRRNFGLIAASYDRANDWMSLGLLHRWRRQLVKMSEVQPGQKVLDTATGTGDLAFLFAEAVGPKGAVTGLDFTQEMLDIAREKEWQADLPVRWLVGDVLKLPMADHAFDISAIAFGIRNVEDPVQGLRELARVTRPGGKVMVLETGRPRSFVWRQLYSTYFGRMIPAIGGMVAKHRGPYEFLYRSTMKFPCGEDFLQWMCGLNVFQSVKAQPLMGGAAYIYEGIVAAKS